MSSCTGECCDGFPIGGLSYAELEGRYHRLRDGATVFDMVRPLPQASAGGEPLFRCVRWDAVTRRCTRYSERPNMCRDYPYEGECRYCDHREPWVTRFVWSAIRCGLRAGTWHGRPFVFDVAALSFPG